jgi:hypothetical protein
VATIKTKYSDTINYKRGDSPWVFWEVESMKEAVGGEEDIEVEAQIYKYCIGEGGL